MTRAERDAQEHDAATYYEGPQPPERFAHYVAAFVAAHPGGTVNDWALYATRLAHRAYREGYTRGKEWRERDIETLGGYTPEQVDERDHGWEWRSQQMPTSEELAAKVNGDLLEDLPDDDARAKYLDALGRYAGTFRIVVSR